VCLRECEGDCAVRGRRKVCSRCCVERGVEGEVRCFECLGLEGEGEVVGSG